MARQSLQAERAEFQNSLKSSFQDAIRTRGPDRILQIATMIRAAKNHDIRALAETLAEVRSVKRNTSILAGADSALLRRVDYLEKVLDDQTRKLGRKVDNVVALLDHRDTVRPSQVGQRTIVTRNGREVTQNATSGRFERRKTADRRAEEQSPTVIVLRKILDYERKNYELGKRAQIVAEREMRRNRNGLNRNQNAGRGGGGNSRFSLGKGLLGSLLGGAGGLLGGMENTTGGGAAVGGVLGGMLGPLGAVAGGYVGNDIEKSFSEAGQKEMLKTLSDRMAAQAESQSKSEQLGFTGRAKRLGRLFTGQTNVMDFLNDRDIDDLLPKSGSSSTPGISQVAPAVGAAKTVTGNAASITQQQGEVMSLLLGMKKELEEELEGMDETDGEHRQRIQRLRSGIGTVSSQIMAAQNFGFSTGGNGAADNSIYNGSGAGSAAILGSRGIGGGGGGATAPSSVNNNPAKPTVDISSMGSLPGLQKVQPAGPGQILPQTVRDALPTQRGAQDRTSTGYYYPGKDVSGGAAAPGTDMDYTKLGQAQKGDNDYKSFAYQMLRKRGYSNEEAAIIMGQTNAESGFDPRSINPNDSPRSKITYDTGNGQVYSGRDSIGLQQRNDVRGVGMIKHGEKLFGKKWSSMSNQERMYADVDYTDKELKGSHKAAGDILKNPNLSFEEKSGRFGKAFEGYAGPIQQGRTDNARRYAEQGKNGAFNKDFNSGTIITPGVNAAAASADDLRTIDANLARRLQAGNLSDADRTRIEGQRQELQGHISKLDAQATTQSSPVGTGSVTESQGDVARTRKLPINDALREQLQYAAEKAGVKVDIFSGGQARIGSGGPRTGSTRHDDGGAADLRLYATDPTTGQRRLLDMNRPDDVAKMEQFARASVEAGATGIGAGQGYMGPNSMHIGGGKPAYWGGAEFIGRAFEQGRNNPNARTEFEAWRAQKAAAAAAAAPGAKPAESALSSSQGGMFKDRVAPADIRQRTLPYLMKEYQKAQAQGRAAKPEEATLPEISVTGSGTTSSTGNFDRVKPPAVQYNNAGNTDAIGALPGVDSGSSTPPKTQNVTPAGTESKENPEAGKKMSEIEHSINDFGLKSLNTPAYA